MFNNNILVHAHRWARHHPFELASWEAGTLLFYLHCIATCIAACAAMERLNTKIWLEKHSIYIGVMSIMGIESLWGCEKGKLRQLR